MQRSNVTRQAQALLPCDDHDDDDGDKNKPLVFYLTDARLRKANFGALLIGVSFVMLYSGGFLTVSRSGVLTASRSVPSWTSGVATHGATAPTTIQPLVCHDFIRQVHSGSYRVPISSKDPNQKKTQYRRIAVKDPNEKMGHLNRRTVTEFPFFISLHHEQHDHRRWNIYKHGQYYQHARANIWTDILKKARPGARVIDIGYVKKCYVICFAYIALRCLLLRAFFMFLSDTVATDRKSSSTLNKPSN
jgi:hypothetical protein